MLCLVASFECAAAASAGDRRSERTLNATEADANRASQNTGANKADYHLINQIKQTEIVWREITGHKPMDTTDNHGLFS